MKIISYYLNSGDQENSEMFSHYLWEEYGFDRVLENYLTNDYGHDLTLLLIAYYLEGKFSSYLPQEPVLGNYLKKNKDIRISIGVTSGVFRERNEFERREFIVDSTINSIKLVKGRLSGKKLHIDFEQLFTDVKLAANEYLIYPKPYITI